MSSAPPPSYSPSASVFASPPTEESRYPAVDAIARLSTCNTPALFSPETIGQDRDVYPARHLIKNSINLKKDAVHIALVQRFIFLQPPGRLYGSGEEDGRGVDGQANGFIYVTSTEARTVRGIQVRLVGHQKLAFTKDGGKTEDSDIFEREVMLGGPGTDGVRLEVGLNSFEFRFTVPATSATFERTTSGRIQHHIRVKVLGSAGSKKKKSLLFKSVDLEDEADLYFVGVPPRDENNLSLSLNKTGYDPSLGPLTLSLSSSHFVVGSPLDVSLHLASPPPNLAIYALNVFVSETITIQSAKDPEKTSSLKRPKAFALRAGSKATGGQFAEKGWAKKARERGEVLWVNDVEGGEEAEWRFEKIGRMPDDDKMRPATLPGTITSIRVSSEIVVELAFSVLTSTGEEKVFIATMLREPISVVSCCALSGSTVLPDYTATAGETYVHDRIDHCPCMCNQPWALLEKKELDLRKSLESSSSTSRTSRSSDSSIDLDRLGLGENGGVGGLGIIEYGRDGRERKVGELY